jgi:Uma2 family endonuclease
MATVILEDHAELEVPTVNSLAEFRRWALSDDFPEQGRIDYVLGKVEIDMSPEDLFTHGTLKAEVAGEIKERVRQLALGYTFVGETRISSVPGNVSSEPDVVVIGFDALDNQRVSLIPKASGKEGRYVEVEGAADLIVEIVSDSSVAKDNKRLPVAYFAAGVREFWLIDARRENVKFQVFKRGDGEFVLTEIADDGFQFSAVLDSWYELDRQRSQRGHWVYRLLAK